MSKKRYNPRPFVPTPEPAIETGRAISARNATKHGCCSTQTLILPTESHDEYKSLETAWHRSYNPKDAAEIHLVHQLVEADWFLQRSTRTVAEVESQLPGALDWTDQQHKTIARFLRYQTTRNNIVVKRQKAIEDYRRNRAAEAARVQIARDRAEKLTIAQSKLKAYRDRTAPECTWDEHLAGMRRKAIALGFTPPPNPMSK